MNITLFLLVFMRMTGCVVFNPILGRRNIPVIARVGLTLVLSIVSYQTISSQTVEINSVLVFFVTMLEQLLIGYMVGFVIQSFLAVLLISGENMDLQIGFSMSKIYDPQSNVSMPLSASMMNAMFFLIFFASNSHLTLIKIFSKLCTMIPYQGFQFHQEMFAELAGLFSLILIYSMKLALPMLAVQMILEIAVGLIMRAVPQIDIFAINIQAKLIIGILVILIMVPSLSTFLDRLISLMFDNIQNIFKAFLTASQ